MTLVTSNDKTFANWVDFINYKFSNNKYFHIDIKSDERHIIINSKTNTTKIWFYFTDYKLSLLEDYHFTSDNCKGWSGESEIWNDKINLATFNQINIDKLDTWLKTPLYDGWYSVDSFLNDSFIKAKAYYDSDKKNIISTQHDSSFSVMTILFFPIFIFIRFLIDKDIMGKKITTLVTPIINNSPNN